MAYAFLIPGFMGSLLDQLFPSGQRLNVWVNEGILVNPLNWNLLQLNADGDGPGPLAGGANIVPNRLWQGYYGRLHDKLREEYTVVDLPYDWRHSIAQTATELTQTIRTYTGGQDYVLVGHSMGGLIARLIWAQEQGVDRRDKLKRIVTLGTPHWGSYRAVQLLARLDPTYQQIANVIGILPQVLSVLGLPSTFFGNLVASQILAILDRVIASWPSVYELFPNLAEPNFAGDPVRAQLYQQISWSPFNGYVTQQNLTDARSDIHRQLAGAVPPPSQIVCVRALGVPTPAELSDIALLPQIRGYGLKDGDGAVTANAAWLGDVGLQTKGLHDRLPLHVCVLSHVLDWLRGTLTSCTATQQVESIVPPVGNVPLVVGPLLPEPLQVGGFGSDQPLQLSGSQRLVDP